MITKTTYYILLGIILITSHARTYNPEHLKLARQGSKNLEGFDLSFSDLSNMDFSKANLKKAILDCVDLTDANLSWADLSFAKIRYANLSHVKAHGCIFKKTNLSHSNLDSADLLGSSFYDANIDYASLTNATIVSVHFYGTNTYYVDLKGAKISACYGLTESDIRTSAEQTKALWADAIIQSLLAQLFARLGELSPTKTEKPVNETKAS